MQQPVSLPESFAFLAFLVALYFAPSIIALRRGHRNTGPIIALDLFLGWSLIGWVAALVWSLSNQAPETVKALPTTPPANAVRDETKTCPQCAEDVKAAALKCRFCGHDFTGG